MADLERLLAVQELDTAADRLHHRRSHLPERVELAAHMDQLVVLDKESAPVRERRHELERAEKAIEDEIAALVEKAGAVEHAMYKGGVSNPRELQALQEELDSLKRRRSALEDKELEQMVEGEPLDAELAAADARRATIDDEAIALTATIAEAEAAIDAELAGVERQRDEAATGVAPELLEQYSALRKRLGGVGIARLDGQRCLGCHLALSAVDIDALKKLPPDAVPECGECGRILVR